MRAGYQADLTGLNHQKLSTFFGQFRVRLLLLVLLPVIPGLLLAVCTGLEQRKHGVAEAKANAVRIAKLAAAHQEGLIENAYQLLAALSQLPQIHHTNAAFWQLNFSSLLKLQPVYSNFGLIEASGVLFSAAIQPSYRTNLKDRAYFQAALSSGEFSVGDLETGPFTNITALNFAYPIKDPGGTITRVLFASLGLDAIGEIAKKAELSSSAVLLILDRNGRILARSLDPEKWVGKLAADSDLIKAVLAKTDGTAELAGLDGAERLYGFAAIKNRESPTVYAVVGIPREIAYTQANRMLIRNFTMLTLVGILALLIAHIYAHWYLLHPIQTLTQTTRRLARGDLTARTGLAKKTNELHQLAEAFDEMAERLAERQNEINRLNMDLERRVHERTTQLEAANRELEAFSYSVSHDLRAPLRHVDGFAAMLENHAAASLDEKSRRYLQVISQASKKMGCLIDDLLVFSRMGRVDLRKVWVNLNVLVGEVIQECETEARGRSIDWKLQALPEVYGDPSLLRQVLVNLISNAIKYTRPRERACIEIGQLESNPPTIFVRDNGVGFDMNYSSKLFQVFQRLHGEREFEGTGIGLANVHRIVSRHGGRVWAEGKVDGGAAFFFTIPCPEGSNNYLRDETATRETNHAETYSAGGG